MCPKIIQKKWLKIYSRCGEQGWGPCSEQALLPLPKRASLCVLGITPESSSSTTQDIVIFIVDFAICRPDLNPMHTFGKEKHNYFTMFQMSWVYIIYCPPLLLLTLLFLRVILLRFLFVTLNLCCHTFALSERFNCHCEALICKHIIFVLFVCT